MRKCLYVIALLSACLIARADVLDNFFSKLETNTLEGNFSVTLQENVTQPMTYNGFIQMHGEQFRAQLLGMEVAWDGSTLYSFSEDQNELTLSVPTADELAEANPLLYAKALRQSCEVMENDRGNNVQVILTPLNTEAGVRNFSIIIEKKTLLPLQAQMRETNNRTTILKIIDTKFTNNVPSFQIQREGAYINDIR